MDHNPRTLTSKQDMPPLCYVIEKRTVHCTNCNAQHEYSEAFELRVYRNYKNYKNLAPLRSQADLQYNMPVRIDNRGTTFTAMCHDCATQAIVKHLPKPPQAQFINKTTNLGQPEPKPTKQSKKPPTLDDL